MRKVFAVIVLLLCARVVQGTIGINPAGGDVAECAQITFTTTGSLSLPPGERAKGQSTISLTGSGGASVSGNTATFCEDGCVTIKETVELEGGGTYFEEATACFTVNDNISIGVTIDAIAPEFLAKKLEKTAVVTFTITSDDPDYIPGNVTMTAGSYSWDLSEGVGIGSWTADLVEGLDLPDIGVYAVTITVDGVKSTAKSVTVFEYIVSSKSVTSDVNGFYNISAVPVMPNIKLKISANPLSAETYAIKYSADNDFQFSRSLNIHWEGIGTGVRKFVTDVTKDCPDNGTSLWDIATTSYGSNIYGGLAKATLKSDLAKVDTSCLFFIRGLNPSETEIQNRANTESVNVLLGDTSVLWNLIKLGEYAGGTPLQFDSYGLPIEGNVGDLGICQILDFPDANNQFVWNWKVNIDCGNNALISKKNVADYELITSPNSTNYNMRNILPNNPIPLNVTKYWAVQEYNGRGYYTGGVYYSVGLPILFYSWDIYVVPVFGYRIRTNERWCLKNGATINGVLNNNMTYVGKYSERVNGAFASYRSWPWSPQN